MERSIVTLIQRKSFSICKCGLNWTKLITHIINNRGTASLVRRQLHSQSRLLRLPAMKLLQPNNAGQQLQWNNMITNYKTKINNSVNVIQNNKFHVSKPINSSYIDDDQTQSANTNKCIDSTEDNSQQITKVNPVLSDDIEDVEEYIETEDIQPAWIPPVSLKRSKKGVFEINELVTLLREGKAYDICVLEIPKHINFVDHMVIVSALSSRHMLALTNNIKFVYKKRKSKKDSFFKVEGLDTNNWYAMDMGNIMLHIFMPETREMYDIETLWTVGEEFDSRTSDEMMNAYAMSESDMMLLRLGLEVNSKSDDLHSDEMGLDNRP